MKTRNNQAAVIFGEVLFDRFPDGSTILGGAPFNVAWNLKALTAEPLLISRVGQDELANRIIGAMRSWGMDPLGLQVDSRHPTGTVEVSIEAGEPAYEIASEKAYDFIAAADLPSLPASGLLYHGSLALRSETSRLALDRLLAELKAPVFLDVNLRAPWWQPAEVLDLLTRARWVKLNEAELAELVPNQTTLCERALNLLEQFPLQCLVVTRGKDGVWFGDRMGNVFEAEAPAVSQIKDTVGAGDAFSSVAVLGLLLDWEWPVILERALAFAAAVVGLRGATTTNREFYETFTRDWELS